MKKLNIFLSLTILYVIACIILSPARYITAGLNGISAWAFNVLPSVFPFMILTKVLCDLGIIEKVCNKFGKFTSKIFGTSSISGYVFFMSVLSGYPVGSKMIADLYESGKINQTDALRMSSFCSNSGPMFIVGSVGSLMLKSAKIGYIILASHIISAIINGLIYRKITTKQEFQTKTEFEYKEFNFGDVILSSCQAILSVGAIITLFFIIIESLSPVFNLFSPTLSAFLSGLIEITKGCLEISKLGLSQLFSTSLCSFIITFGGFSTIMQSVALLKRVKMKISTFTLQKLSQAVLSFFVSFLICMLI